MLLRSIILVSTLAIAGCVTTDGSGKPIAREVKTVKATDRLESAMANATLDGSRIVASGKPGSVSYVYPGNGRLAVRDLETGMMPFSIDLPAEAGNANRVLIAIAPDGKLTGSTSAGEGEPVVTHLGQVDRTHTYVMTYMPAASPRTGEGGSR